MAQASSAGPWNFPESVLCAPATSSTLLRERSVLYFNGRAMVHTSARFEPVAGGRRSPIMRVLPGLMVVMLLGALDQTIMAPALPAVAGDLGGLDEMPVVLTAYLVAATVVMPVYGRLGDRFGRKPVLLVAIVVFVIGAVASGLSGSIPALVVAR